jgi:hypothetical protein
MKKLIWVLLVVLAVSIAANIWQCSNEVEPSVVVEHDTVWRDTAIYEPQPAETIQTGRVVYIKAAAVQPQIQRDTVHDSIDVPVQIVQKRYDDDLYTAWVSGFEPNLDSINLRLPTITETVTKTIVRPAPRLSLGIQAGGGIGIFGRHPDIYVGVGLQWRLFEK